MAADLHQRPTLAVIGGGPAGLMAAEVASAAGIAVDLYERKGSVGRKFLLAGKGGLNLTHGEAHADFVRRYGPRQPAVATWLEDFDAMAIRAWARGLGIETFVGSSGRVFPRDLKAAPLLRAWVRRLRESGVRFHMHHRWLGWDDAGALQFERPAGAHALRRDATVLALGGGSWPQLGSDGEWQPALAGRGIALAPLQAANCGFDIAWSPWFAAHHAGAALKPVVAFWRNGDHEYALQGECVVTATGIEGSLVYAVSAPLRDAIVRDGSATLWLDLAPGRSLERLRAELGAPRGSRTISEHLRRKVGIEGVKAALLREFLAREQFAAADALAAAIKRLPLRLLRPRPVAEAISSAGGVRLEALDQQLMVDPRRADVAPGLYCAGEMLDWEAPTGGYLLSACLASGRRAGLAAAARLLDPAQAPQHRG